MALWYLVAAGVAGLGGLGLVFGSWRRVLRAPRRSPLKTLPPLRALDLPLRALHLSLRAPNPALAGWLLLILSGWFWVLGSGAEFGVTLAFLVPSVLAWLVVLGNRQLRQRREKGRVPPSSAASLLKDGTRSWGRHVVLFLLVVPVAAVASALVTVAMSLLLPWREVDAMVLVLVVMPILWGAAAYWSVADSRTVRPALAMVAGSLLSAAFIYA